MKRNHHHSACFVLTKQKLYSDERGYSFKDVIFFSYFLRIKEKVSVQVAVVFAPNRSKCTSQLLIDGFPSKLHPVLREKRRATWTIAGRRNELTPCPPDGIHYEEIENSPVRFFRGFLPPARTSVELPLAGCTRLRWILKQWVFSSGRCTKQDNRRAALERFVIVLNGISQRHSFAVKIVSCCYWECISVLSCKTQSP